MEKEIEFLKNYIIVECGGAIQFHTMNELCLTVQNDTICEVVKAPETKENRFGIKYIPFRATTLLPKIVAFCKDIQKAQLKRLRDQFIQHFKNGTGISYTNVPKELLRVLPHKESVSGDNIEIYAVDESNEKITNIYRWTFNEQKLELLSLKYESPKVFKLTTEKLSSIFHHWVSMDVIYRYLYENDLGVPDLDGYVSESEILVVK